MLGRNAPGMDVLEMARDFEGAEEVLVGNPFVKAFFEFGIGDGGFKGNGIIRQKFANRGKGGW